MKTFSNFAKLFVLSLVANEINAQTPNFVPNTNAPLDQRVGAIENYIVSSQQGGTNVQSPATPMTTYPAAAPQVPMVTRMTSPMTNAVIQQQNPMLAPNQMLPTPSPMIGTASPMMPVAQTIPMPVQVPVAPVAVPTMPAAETAPAMENAPAAA